MSSLLTKCLALSYCVILLVSLPSSMAHGAMERLPSKHEPLPGPIWHRTPRSSQAQPSFLGVNKGGVASLTAIAVPMKVWTQKKLLVEAFTSGWLCPQFGPHTQPQEFVLRRVTADPLPKGTLVVFNEKFGLVRSVFVSATSPDGRAVVACGNWTKQDDATLRIAMLWQLRTIVPEVLAAP